LIGKKKKHQKIKKRLIKSEDVGILMQDEKADLVFTDPLWNVNYGQNPPSWKKREKIKNDNLGDGFFDFIKNSLKVMSQTIKDGCMTYIVMSAQEWGTIMNITSELNYHWSSTIIWKKNRLVLSRKDYHTQYEPIWYGWFGDKALCHLEDRTQSDVWEIERPNISEEHPTMKPVELVLKALNNSSKKGNVVFDGFGGSGTTLIVAEKIGRKCRMCEIDPVYCQVIIDRWEKYTNKKAVKLG
jgi:DNA modification methylase